MGVKPRVSIIIPIYNHAKFIAEAIRSVLNQTFQDFEIIITNDASTDESIDEINNFNDPRIKIFNLDKNSGISAAMNNSIVHATGEYIAHLNADDAFSPDKLKKQVDFLDGNKEIGAVFTHVNVLDENGIILDDKTNFYFDIFDQPNRNRFEWLNYFFYKGNCLCHPSVLIRRECFDNVGLYDVRFHGMQDFEVWTRLCMQYEIHVIQEKLTSFRVLSDGSNVSGNNPSSRIRAEWEATKILDHFTKLNAAELRKVFCEIDFEDLLEDDLVPYYLSGISSKINKAAHQHFALEAMYSLFGSDVLHQKLNQLHNVNSQKFISLTGNLDIFNVLNVEKLNNSMRGAEQAIKSMKEEIVLMRSSKFWKIRRLYLKLKFMFFYPDKFIKKYYNKIKYLANSLNYSLKRDGLGNACKRVRNYIKFGKGTLMSGTNEHGSRIDERYQRWIKNEEKIEKDRGCSNVFDELKEFQYNPLVSVLLPVYNSDEIFLRKAIFSVINQCYQNWELCIVDDRSNKSVIRGILEEFKNKYPRIKVKYLEKNLGISGSTNIAAKIATGEFITFLDHDDELESEALFENVKLLNKNKDLDLIYSDDDKINENGYRYDPQFKPDWSPELLLSYCYVSHLKFLRRSLFLDTGGFRSEFDGSQDYDFLLRMSEKTEKIGHIPKILYHWRSVPGSVAHSAGEKPLSVERGRIAVQEALNRRGIFAKVVQPDFANDANLGIYQIRFNSNKLKDKVTIIIPTKDSVDLLKKCIFSIKKKTDYKNYEIVVINNNSTKKETFEFLKREKIKHFNVQTDKFNYAKINNVVANKTDSELILFLNNDTEIISSKWLTEMVGIISMDNNIGAVGAKLIYADKRIQHAGIILGLNGGSAGHANKLLKVNDSGYLAYNLVLRNYSAVTAACMLTRKSLFREVGGFDEDNLAVAYNDVDYCLKICAIKKRVVFTPNALLFHYEGVTRGFKDNLNELKYFKNKWKNIINNDPFYNKNLSLDNEQFWIK